MMIDIIWWGSAFTAVTFIVVYYRTHAAWACVWVAVACLLGAGSSWALGDLLTGVLAAIGAMLWAFGAWDEYHGEIPHD
jgi:hypothetical protein